LPFYKLTYSKEEFVMSIEVIDLVDMGHTQKQRKNVFSTPRFHAGCTTTNRGRKTRCIATTDLTFVVLEGECTMSFPDGGKVTLKPGQAALVTGGSFYMLENTGEGPMIMMGNRSGPAEKIQIIDYVTRKDVREKVQADFNV